MLAATSLPGEIFIAFHGLCALVIVRLWQKHALIYLQLIGDFRVAFYLCFKASPSAKPFIHM